MASKRLYGQLILAYSGTKMYTSLGVYKKDNVIGDQHYIGPEENHPLCIDENSVIDVIKLSNFTTSIDNTSINKVQIYDKTSNLFLFEYLCNLSAGQEGLYKLPFGGYKLKITLVKTNTLLSNSRGDLILKNTTDDDVLFTDSTSDLVVEFTPFDTLLSKEYQLLLNS